MSYGYKILKAAVEQQIEFKNYDNYKDYIDSNYVVPIKEQLNLDGSFVAIIRKRYNNNDFLDMSFDIEPDLYTIGEYEDMRMFAKSLNVGDDVLCEFEDNIIKTEIVKAFYRSDDPEWFDNTTIELLREADIGVEYDYSGEFVTHDDCIFLFMKTVPEYEHEYLSECPMCHRTATLSLTYEELNKVILYQNGYIKGLIQDIFPKFNPVEREFVKTGYCVACQQLLFGSNLSSKRINYKK